MGIRLQLAQLMMAPLSSLLLALLSIAHEVPLRVLHGDGSGATGARLIVVGTHRAREYSSDSNGIIRVPLSEDGLTGALCGISSSCSVVRLDLAGKEPAIRMDGHTVTGVVLLNGAAPTFPVDLTFLSDEGRHSEISFLEAHPEAWVLAGYSGHLAVQRVDSRGRFGLTIPDGDYPVAIRLPLGYSQASGGRTIVIRQGTTFQVIEIERGPGVIGRVTSGDDEVVSDARCAYRITCAEGGTFASYVSAGEQGSFYVPVACDEAAEVTISIVSHARGMGRLVEARQSGSSALDLGSVSLGMLRNVELRICDREGSAVSEGIEVVTLDPAAVTAFSRDGIVHLQAVVPDSVNVLVTSRGYEPRVIAIPQGAKEVFCSLQNDTGFEVRVRGRVATDLATSQDHVVTMRSGSWPFRQPYVGDRCIHQQFIARGRYEDGRKAIFMRGSISENMTAISLLPGGLSGIASFSDIIPNHSMEVFLAAEGESNTPVGEIVTVEVLEGEWKVIELHRP